MSLKEEGAVTVRELYELIDQKMNVVNQSITRLENKFDTLENGRLSRIERELANQQGKMMMIPILLSITISAFFSIMNYVLTRIK